MRPRLTAGAVGVALLMVVVTSCSSSSTESKPVAAPVLTLESATTWYGRASEAAHPCQVSSKAVDDALDAAASESAKSDTNVPVMLAAGQAVEDCTISADSDTVNRLIAEMDPVFPDGTALVRQWIDAMAQAVAKKPDLIVDVVSNAPETGNDSLDAKWVETASHNTRAVVASLERMGVPRERMRITGQADPEIKYDETRIYVR